MTLTKASYYMINGAPVNVLDYGAVGDGTTDDTVAIQAAIDACSGSNRNELYIPPGKYRCTAKLSVTGAISIRGTGASPYQGSGTITQGPGSWLFFDHSGVGLEINSGTGSLISGVYIKMLGTYRTQPTPTVGWVPNNHDYDFVSYNSDTTFEDIMMLNPTYGIKVTEGGYGRFEGNRIRGQAFKKFIFLEKTYDTTKLNELHQWPFWKDDSNVHEYCLNNLTFIHAEACDNPMFSNIFSIYAKYGFLSTRSASGGTNAINMVNADFDKGNVAICLDSTTDTVTGQFVNIKHQAEVSVITNTAAILVQGNDCRISFDNFVSTANSGSAVLVNTGTGNFLTFGPALRLVYDDANTGAACITADALNPISIETSPIITTSGSGARYGTGDIRVNEWRSYTPTVRSTTGTLTSYTSVGKYKYYGDTLDYIFNVDITNNGTGSGSIGVSLPTGFSTSASSAQASGSGKSITSGDMIVGLIGPGVSSEVVITNYLGAYPATTGTELTLTGTVDL